MSLAGYIRVAGVGALLALTTCAESRAQRYSFRQYGSQDGLGNLSTTCLLQDQTGYIWVGTDNGLFRYDGNRFRGFSHADGLPNSEILGMAESPQGVLWVATQGGIVRSDGHKFKVVDGTKKEAFQAVAFDGSGNVYLEHNAGIIRGQADGAGWYRFSDVAKGPMSALFVNGDDVWFARDGDLWHLRGQKEDKIGSPAGLPIEQWTAIAKDSQGNLWVRSATHLFERPGTQARFVDRSEGITHATRPRLFADSHGRLFVSSDSGVVIFRGGTRTIIDPEHGLPSDTVAPILMDRGDSLWLGMFGGGLVRRLGHGEWLSWQKADGLLHNSVWAVHHDRSGRLWVGTSGGLSIFGANGKLEHSWTSHNGLAGDWVRAITEGPAGDFFVGTSPSGISHFSKDGMLLKTYRTAAGQKIDQLIAMAVDQQHRLWVAGPAAGCLRSRKPLNGSSDLEFERVDIAGLPPQTTFRDVLAGENGTVWITTSQGVARFDGNNWKIFTTADGLRSNDLSAIAEGHGSLWLGYRDALGIARLELHGDRFAVSRFTQQDGLSSDLIYALALDPAGRLWASTDNGLDVFDQNQWRHYGREDGLIWDDGNDLALSVDHDGSIWVGTSGGLSRLSPSLAAKTTSAPPVVLTAIEGTSREFQAGDRLVLPHAQDSLLIRFSGLDYSSETRMRFRYRLLGYKTSWSETSEKSVHFEGLPGGHYVFEVIACGPSGEWSPVAARFAFSISPPWWQSWWFLTACVFTVLFLARVVWQFRVRGLMKQKELLKKQVADQTAELIESHRQLEELAYCDVLTSLPNRRMFTEQFRSRAATAYRYDKPFALLLVDLDHFKGINDTFGHDAGDAVLFEVAARLRVAVRESDCVARLGGDEFAILLTTAHDPVSVERICHRIIEGLSARIPFKDEHLSTGCSIGVAVFPTDSDTQEGLYKSADLALYAAKRTRRNSFCWYCPEIADQASPEFAPAREN
jgi:diguanylate cyclase (GGDEF)-like protein